MGPMMIMDQFSLVNARDCLEAAQYTYAYDCGLVTELAHASVLDAGNARIVAFRGSASMRDWLTDFECTMLPAAEFGGEVHRGFLVAIRSIQGELIKRAGWTKAPVFVTGHSLGGAMALLAAQVLERGGFPVQAVYTFGGPRTGNRSWAQSYDANLGRRTYRVVNEEDIVPRVPGLLMGYRHVGTEVFLPSIGGMTINPPLWRKALSDAVGTYLDWKRGRIAQLVDHKAAAYDARLAALGTPPMPQEAAQDL